MSGLIEQYDELGELTAALCDGEITPAEAARLEQLANRSARSRQFFLRYVQLHGELHWEHAASVARESVLAPESLAAGTCSLAEPADAGKPIGRAEGPLKSPYRWVAAAAVAAGLVVGVSLGVALSRLCPGQPEGPSTPPLVAQVTRVFEAQWADGSTRPERDALAAGERLDLRQGLAEIRFSSGARVILQGPAKFEATSATQGTLQAGVITANVPPVAAGFAIHTPNAIVVDLGTEFGVSAEEEGPTEVHVFVGKVQVRPGAGLAEGSAPTEVLAGEAVSVSLASGTGDPRMDRIDLEPRRFARAFPLRGSVAALRALVARNPYLLHHYTFEGVSRQERYEDKKGELDLAEVVMRRGAGEGALDYSAAGLDPTTNAVRPYRSRQGGDETGVGLESRHREELDAKSTFRPPDRLTVELLLSFGGFPARAKDEISTAVATRADEQDCGFFVAVAGRGRLVHLMQADAPSWVEGEIEFVPGHWYYVASTFEVQSGKTTINSYAANLSRGDMELQWVVKDEVAAGEPAASRLGIGKGFAHDVASAYPWSGTLDEVAVYDAVLEVETLREHLRALTGER